MNEALIDKMRMVFEKNPDLIGLPATAEEIIQAEELLDVKFNDQYIEFIKNFGGAFGGVCIHAFHNSYFSGKSTVIDLTLRFRRGMGQELSSKTKGLYVISIDGSGNPILMSKQGVIYVYWHDEKSMEVFYNSLEDMLNEVKWDLMLN